MSIFPNFNLPLLSRFNPKCGFVLKKEIRKESKNRHNLTIIFSPQSRGKKQIKKHFREQAELCIHTHTFCIRRPRKTWPQIHTDKLRDWNFNAVSASSQSFQPLMDCKPAKKWHLPFEMYVPLSQFCLQYVTFATLYIARPQKNKLFLATVHYERLQMG